MSKLTDFVKFVFFPWKYILDIFFKNKSILLTGPKSSGKTTFLRHFKKDIIEGATSAHQEYVVNDTHFKKVKDMAGDSAWLYERFDREIEGYDYSLLFFNVSEYVKDEDYRDDSNARIQMIHNICKKTNQKLLLVGTHIDFGECYRCKVIDIITQKPYREVINNLVFIDTRRDADVKTKVLDKLKE